MSSKEKKEEPKRATPIEHSNEGNVATKKQKIGEALDDDENDETKSGKIWLNNKLVPRPNYPTSHGILLYRKPSTNAEQAGNDESDAKKWKNIFQQSDVRYLLGLIPQGNSWTVFKGLPEPNETPEETAVREFEEETSLKFPYDCKTWPVKAELYGVTSTKKLLHIYLMEAPSDLDTKKFDVDKVVKIDSGRFAGVPEIIEIKFLTKKQAIQGIPGRGKQKAAKIYKSQISILERADAILNNRV